MFTLLYFTLIFFKLTQDEIEYKINRRASSLSATWGTCFLLLPRSFFLLLLLLASGFII